MNQKNAYLIQREKKIQHQKAMRIRKIRRIRRILFLGGTSLILITVVCLFKNMASSGTSAEEPISAGSVYSEDMSLTSSASVQLNANTASFPYKEDLEKLVDKYPKIQTLLDNHSDYPEPLLKIASKNPETLDFVLDYPEKKDSEPAETIGEVTQGTVPLLLQWDERWGYASYGSSIVAVSGCGPTCIAMVASGLTGRDDITPAAVAEYSANNGFLTDSLDTSWDLMTYGAEAFGVTGTMLGLDENAMINTLDSGYPIICSVRPGDFTTGGHFIVITGYENGEFTVNDPNSEIRSAKTWSFDRLKDQIKNMWYYTEL